MIRIILFFIFFFHSLSASIISNINITGNKRLDNESILILGQVKKGDNVNDYKLNNIAKKLQSSGYFKNVFVDLNGQTLNIKVEESKVIGEVTVEGNDEINTDDLKKEIRLKPLMPYNESVIGADIKRILLVYKRKGFFRTKVVPKKIETADNKINIVYEITEDQPIYIKNISFEGNETFSSRTLRQQILSREYAWWKFLAQFDVYDEDRIAYDGQMLRQFYLRHGFVDFKLLSTKGELSNDGKDYSVTFVIEEGEIYKFGKVSIINNFKDIKDKELYDVVKIEEGNTYNIDYIDKTINSLKGTIAEYGYAFVNIEPIFDIKDKVVNIKFNIKKTDRIYLNNINIFGNVRTFDSVINHMLPMRAGDPFSLQTIEMGRQNLMHSGYFKNVNIVPKRIEESNLIDLDVNIEEQPTGELSNGIGWSSVNGFMIDAGIAENNFMGRGQTVQLKLSLAQYQQQLAFSFTEPYLFDRSLSAGFDVSLTSTKYENLASYAYNSYSTMISGRLGWYLTDNWSQSLRLSANFDSNQERLTKTQKNELYTLSTNFRYYNLDTNFAQNTHTGITGNINISYTGFGGTEEFMKYGMDINALYKFFDDRWQFRTSLDFGLIQPLKEKGYIQRVYRYFLGGDTLRGFDMAGVGSRNWFYKNYALGGMWKINGSTQLNFPIFIPDEYNIKGFIFTDYGLLGKPPKDDYKYLGKNNFIDNDLRTSAGFGIFWFTPMGPMNFSWGWPLKMNKYDDERRFLLSFSTRF